MTGLRISVALTLVVAAVGGHSTLSAAAGTRTITVKDDVFSPGNVTIAKNTLVTFRWADGSGAHDVASRGTRRFRSSKIQSDGVYRVRFKTAGTYKYVCTLHEDEGMTGRLVVR